jgi:ABC-type multidrug transport system fused ATPase/permease subunit
MIKICKSLLSRAFSEDFSEAFFNIFYFMKNYRVRFLFLSLFGIIVVFLDLASLYSIALLIDAIERNPTSQIGWLDSFSNPLSGLSVSDALIIVVLSITILQILRETALFANEVLTKKFGLDVSTRLREEIAELSLTRRYEALSQMDRGEIILYGTNFAAGTGVFAQEFIRLFVNLVTISAYTVFFVYLEPTLFSLISVIIISLILLTNKLHLKIEKYGTDARGTEIRYYKKFQDSINGFKDISLYGKGAAFLEDIKSINERYKSDLWNQSLAQAMISPAQKITAFALFCSASVVGLLIWKDEHVLDPDRVFLVLFLLLRIYGPVTQLNLIRSTLMARTGVVSIIAKFLQSYRHSDCNENGLTSSLQVPDTRSNQSAEQITVDLNNVYYSYRESDLPTLKNVSLTLNSGETVALVGPSGAGKSTLADIITGLRSPSNGTVRWQTAPNSKTRPKIATIHQRGYIFYGSLSQNITMFDTRYTAEDVNEAIQKSGLTEFVESLPAKAATLIGGPDNPISGGQSQRIQIARALLTKPALLVLDEATSSQDALGEEAILQTLQTYFSQSTIVMIAHRFSALKTADQILVLENGKIVEKGNWEELSSAGGLFSRLKQAQDMKKFGEQ